MQHQHFLPEAAGKRVIDVYPQEETSDSLESTAFSCLAVFLFQSSTLIYSVLTVESFGELFNY